MRQSIFRRSAAALLAALFFAVLVQKMAMAESPERRSIGHIERLDPALDKLIPSDAKIEVIGEGFAWCEGPVWVRDGGFLLFSDIPHNLIVRWGAKNGCRPFIKPAGYTGSDPRGGESGSNGLTMDRGGHLVLCQHGDRRIAQLEWPFDTKNPTYKTLADRFDDKRFNSPNDLVVDSHGAVYFTDPPYGLEKGMDDPKKELAFQGVYRIAPDGKVSLLTKELARPNGIALSPDEKTLFVCNSDADQPVIMAYPLNTDGTISEGREFFNAKTAGATGPGACDGMKVDTHGNLFATIPGGLAVFTPEGKQLGLISAGGDPIANCAFGEDGSTLFMCANHNVLRLRTNTKGQSF
ncbi:MAG TPA: SMP-30/gluconolactonase/LRE family protein [Lacipirellulaceae bacterium]|nr:SMP-30/gluconolactonase/LRE family protein [Lacipirellulaceae bacterium]